jgi:hypothetical protein
MLISMTCAAQPGIGLRRGVAGYERKEVTTHIEAGIAGGATLLDIVRQGSRDQDIVHSGKAWLAEVDFCHGGKKFPIAFKHGVRFGNDAFNKGFISYVIGLQFDSSPWKDLGLRFSAAAGPMLANFKPDLVAELTAGVLINQRISAGIKYMQPIWPIDTYYHKDYPDQHSDYSVKYILAEIKYRFGPRKI